MSHVVGTVQTQNPSLVIGPDSGTPPTSANTWATKFAHTPAPTGTKFLILHFTGAAFPANNRLEVDLGYDTDVFTAADGTDFWTRPINVSSFPGGLVPIRYITNGVANGGVQLDKYGRGERHAGLKDPTALSNCDPFLQGPSYTEPKYDPSWFCSNPPNTPPNWENIACVTSPGDIRSSIAPSVGMIVHVDFDPKIGAYVSTCTVTLVSADTVVTAGHCMSSPIDDAKSSSIIFNYQTNCDGTRPAGYSGRFFKVIEVIRQRYADGSSNDYCLLRLNVPAGGLGINPIPMRTDVPSVGEQVFGIHHPNGAVKKLSIPHPGFASVASSGTNSIQVNLDVSGGSSGSGLFDTTGRIVGILSNGGPCSLNYFPLATMQHDIATPASITRDVMLVFDRSGSMSLPGTSGAPKIQEAQAAASLFVQLVLAGTGNRVGLVSFSTSASSPVDFALAAVTAANKAALIGPAPFTTGVVGGITPGGSTSIGDGLDAAYAQLVPGANPRNVLLFTDGMQNTPRLVQPSDPLPPNLNIDVIGYGTPASLDGALLTALATYHNGDEQHNGQYVLADTNLKLQKFFALAFGNIFEAGLLLDPEFVLPQDQQEAAPLPFAVCEEETITVVVGWEGRDVQLFVEVTTPSGATVSSSSAGVESSSGENWTFLRIHLPFGGDRDGTWKAIVFRPSGGEIPPPSPEVRYFVSIVAAGGAVLRRMPDSNIYYTGDIINQIIGLQYLEGGLPPNAKLKVTVTKPDTGVGNLLSQQKLGPAKVVYADTIPPRQATLMAIEQTSGHPSVGYTSTAFDLFDDPASTNALEAAGLFGNPLKDFLTVEGDYTFHFYATYGDTCTATRELAWSVHVDVGIDPEHTSVSVTQNGANPDGTIGVTIVVVPRDKYGNNLGPGRQDGVSFTGGIGTTITGTVHDNGDGSYTLGGVWDPGVAPSPGVVVSQPGRPPVALSVPAPGSSGKHIYSVKFVCGVQEPSECHCAPVRPGIYATEINIHNPFDKEVKVKKRVIPLVFASAAPGREPRYARSKAADHIVLPPHTATMDDCCRLNELLFEAKPQSTLPLTIGFLEITSSSPVNVVAVYTVSDLKSGAVAIDVEQVKETTNA